MRVLVLGSTGSIGTQTLDVIDHLNALGERGEGARILLYLMERDMGVRTLRGG